MEERSLILVIRLHSGELILEKELIWSFLAGIFYFPLVSVNRSKLTMYAEISMLR